MRVAIRFVANTVSFRARTSIDDCSCYRDALLFHDKTQRVIHMAPQARITLRRRLLGRGRWWRRGFGRRRGRPKRRPDLGPGPPALVIPRPTGIKPPGWGLSTR